MTKAIQRAVAIALAIVAACASAGGNNGPSDAPPGIDATIHQNALVLPHDAIPPLDGTNPIDAAVPHDAPPVAIDAAIGGQLCTDNTQCPDPGTCCYFFVCTPGLGVGSNLCFEN